MLPMRDFQLLSTLIGEETGICPNKYVHWQSYFDHDCLKIKKLKRGYLQLENEKKIKMDYLHSILVLSKLFRYSEIQSPESRDLRYGGRYISADVLVV